VNDVPMIAFHHGTAGAFADMAIDNLDELVEQSAHQPLVCGIVTHSFIVGQPFRLRRFRKAVEHLLGLPNVWLTTPGEIAEHYAEIEAPPTSGSGLAAAG
jgi:allantoinase